MTAQLSVDAPAADDLVAEMLAITPEVGPNVTEWPGLTAYRLSSPQAPQWAQAHSLALYCVVQGRKRFRVGDDDYVCGAAHYLLCTRGMDFKTEIVEASAAMPCLSFVLQIDPAIVRDLLADMVVCESMSSTPLTAAAEAPAAQVSAFGQDLGEAVLRFLRSLASAADRRVLTPMYLREITYRLMQAEQVPRLLHAAATEGEANPISDVIGYIRDHLSEPITVADLASHVQLSSSALTSVFVDELGIGPYQYAKRMRLNRASALLIQGGRNVSEVSREVGYTSLSYFISEFKRQFGTTPRAYARAQRAMVAMRLGEATSRRANPSLFRSNPPRPGAGALLASGRHA